MPEKQDKVTVEEVMRELRRRKNAMKPPQGYDVMPEDDMSGHGWEKNLTFKFIKDVEDKPKVLRVQEVDFYTSDLKHGCGSDKFLWLVPQRNGVYLACTYCSTVEGPISSEFGRTRKTYEVNIHEGIQIMLNRGWKVKDLPIRGLLKRAKGKRARDLIRKPRPERSV